MPDIVQAIYVVSSGSTDRTNDIVNEYHAKVSKVVLASETARNGKASAFNILLNLAESYDVMVCLGADNLIEKGAVELLLKNFDDNKIGLVGGRGIPLNDLRGFSGWCAHMLWSMHHLVSVRRPKITGEFYAFRPRVVRELPIGMICDDAYIQNLFEIRGFKAVYEPEAKVYLVGPKNIRDFFKQRRRIFTGHRQLHFLLGRKASTFSLKNMKLARKAMPSRGLEGYTYLLGFILVTGTAWLASLWDFLRQKLPYRWEIVESTKILKLLLILLSLAILNESPTT